MPNHDTQFYINGQWIEPASNLRLDVVNPATEEPIGSIALGRADDIDNAVQAALTAFPIFRQTTKSERIELLEAIIAKFRERSTELAEVVSLEMGAPLKLAKEKHVPFGLAHFSTMVNVLKSYEFEEVLGTTRVLKEPIGVCGFITPWNWPINQISCKVAPALAAGCTMILKPSEIAPLNAVLFTEILESAGVPAGVFNLVNGDGSTVGAALASHLNVDMISFTGSTRAGIEVARNAAFTVKRVAQELGGKSANIILDDADFSESISRDVFRVCMNSGQSCNAGSRVLVPIGRIEEAALIAKSAAEEIVIGDPLADETTMGPLASKVQFEKVQELIQVAIDAGAKLETGGIGRPDGFNKGYYLKPTVFSHVTNDMSIAQEEIFGPVLTIIGYRDEGDAVRIANETSYGLSGYVSGSSERATKVAQELRTGMVHINGGPLDMNAPFGGFKQSGNGREWGRHGLEEYLELKSIFV